MAYDNNTEPGIRAARATLQSALQTFATSTLPPLATSVHDLVRAADPLRPMLEPDEMKVYNDLKWYVDRLIARGLFVGPPLPWR
jgi:hypothetical protein